MKTSNSRSRLSLGGGAVLMVVALLFVRYSNATDNQSLTIETDKFTAVQNIQEVHFNPANDGVVSRSDKMGIKNEGGRTLGIGTIDETNRVGKLKNVVDDNSSIIGGVGNESKGSKTTLILGGSGNVMESAVDNSVILGGDGNLNDANNSAILGSSRVSLGKNAANSVVIAGENTEIKGQNSTAYVTKNANIAGANSLAIGSNVTIPDSIQGTFVFNQKNERVIAGKSHSFLVHADKGVIVGKNSSSSPIVQLTVDGAVRVGADICTAQTKGTVARMNCTGGGSCLCTCDGSSFQSVSNNPACGAVCKNKGGSCVQAAQCGSRATAHEVDETTWRPLSAFCANGASPTSPVSFPTAEQSVSWTCPGGVGGTSASCTASRKIKFISAKCGVERKTCEVGEVDEGSVSLVNKTWTCLGINSSASCKILSEVACLGTKPSTDVAILGSETYQGDPNRLGGAKSWTWVPYRELFGKVFVKTCEFTCKKGYTYDQTKKTCIDPHQPQPLDGKCAVLDPVPQGASIPSSILGVCEAGDFANVKETAQGWSWDCNGREGGAPATNCGVSCAAGLVVKNGICQPAVDPIIAKCASVAPISANNQSHNSNLNCAVGTIADWKVDAVNKQWTWKCKGVPTPQNDSAQCSVKCAAGLEFRDNGAGQYGCFCPAGTELQNGVCVKQESETYKWECIPAFCAPREYGHCESLRVDPITHRDSALCDSLEKMQCEDRTGCIWISSPDKWSDSCDSKTTEPMCRRGLSCERHDVSFICRDSKGNLVNESFCTGLTKPSCPSPVLPTSYSCQGAIPANAQAASSTEEEGLTSNTISWKGVASNTAAKCEWICNDGYTLQNGACVKYERSCPKDQYGYKGGLPDCTLNGTKVGPENCTDPIPTLCPCDEMYENCGQPNGLGNAKPCRCLSNRFKGGCHAMRGWEYYENVCAVLTDKESCSNRYGVGVGYDEFGKPSDGYIDCNLGGPDGMPGCYVKNKHGVGYTRLPSLCYWGPSFGGG